VRFTHHRHQRPLFLRDPFRQRAIRVLSGHRRSGLRLRKHPRRSRRDASRHRSWPWRPADHMSDLLTAVVDAHGGLDRWRKFTRVRAKIVTGGELWDIKGQPQDAAPRRVTVALQRQWGSVQPFGTDDQKTDFTPDRIAIEKLDGRVVAERCNPRCHMSGTLLRSSSGPPPIRAPGSHRIGDWTLHEALLASQLVIPIRSFANVTLVGSAGSLHVCFCLRGFSL
jgi:hypothetical protein